MCRDLAPTFQDDDRRYVISVHQSVLCPIKRQLGFEHRRPRYPKCDEWTAAVSFDAALLDQSELLQFHHSSINRPNMQQQLHSNDGFVLMKTALPKVPATCPTLASGKSHCQPFSTFGGSNSSQTWPTPHHLHIHRGANAGIKDLAVEEMQKRTHCKTGNAHLEVNHERAHVALAAGRELKSH